MKYTFKIRYTADGKLQTQAGSLETEVELISANDYFNAIERSLPSTRPFETFSIMEIRKV